MSFTSDVLDALAPMLYSGNEPLGDYLGGLSLPFELVETWASDTDTHIGWSLLLDVDRCPVEALPWLAQMIGMTLDTSLSEANQRQQISQAGNWKRGTLPAMQAAPAPYLTGSKAVIVRERYDGSGNDAPYYMEVITFDAETPNPTLVEAAVRKQKAAGIILTYVHLAGEDYQTVKDENATYGVLKSNYLTYGGVKSHQLGA